MTRRVPQPVIVKADLGFGEVLVPNSGVPWPSRDTLGRGQPGERLGGFGEDLDRISVCELTVGWEEVRVALCGSINDE